MVFILQTWKWPRGVGPDQGHTASQGGALISTVGLPLPRLLSRVLQCLGKTSCWVLSYQTGGRRVVEGEKGVGVVAELEHPPLPMVGVPQEVGGVRTRASFRLTRVGKSWCGS